MKYDSNKHHRHSIRLIGYDYSQTGLYFITICTQNRECLLGKIENGIMQLNDAGRMVEKWYYELENKYPDKRCHEMIVMPNHFHCVIENIASDKSYRDESSWDESSWDESSWDESSWDESSWDAHVGAPLRGRPINECGRPNNNERGRPINECGRPNNNYGIDNKKYNATIGDAIDWLKTMTTNEYMRGVKQLSWQRFDGKFWQRNYYEHIIRNPQSYLKISEYIINNPANWNNDTLNS